MPAERPAPPRLRALLPAAVLVIATALAGCNGGGAARTDGGGDPDGPGGSPPVELSDSVLRWQIEELPERLARFRDPSLAAQARARSELLTIGAPHVPGGVLDLLANWNTDRWEQSRRTLVDMGEALHLMQSYRTSSPGAERDAYRSRLLETPAGRRLLLGELTAALARSQTAAQREQVRNELIAVGEPAVPWLTAVLEAGDDSAREEAVAILAAIGAPAYGPVLELAEEGDLATRTKALRCLGLMDDPRVVEPLGRAARSDRRWEVRTAAVVALGTTGRLAAVPHLVRALSDDEELVRLRAADALRRVGRRHSSAEDLPATSDPRAWTAWYERARRER